MRSMKYSCSKKLVLALGLFSLPLAVFLYTTNASAQSESDAPSKPVPPPGPLLAPAPAFSQWTITFSYPEDQKGNGLANTSEAPKPVPQYMAIRPRTIITTKTVGIIHEETVTVASSKTEDWQIHGSYYTKYPGNSFWSAYEKFGSTQEAIRLADGMALPDSGFRGLNWISKETFAGKIKTSSGDNLVFVPGGSVAVNAEDPSKQKGLESLPTIAYVDAETHLPIMVRAAGETRVFNFSQTPPTSMQTLPDDLAAEIKIGDEIRAKRTAAPHTEY
jgi:hypothetical protein